MESWDGQMRLRRHPSHNVENQPSADNVGWQGGWEEGDVSVWRGADGTVDSVDGLRQPRGYLHCAGRGAPTVHYGTPNRGGLDGHHHGAVVGTVDDFSPRAGDNCNTDGLQSV